MRRFDLLQTIAKTRLVELVEPTKFTARLSEPALAEDALSKLQTEELPTYNAYSADGDVTGELVYVNYGIPADYEELARRGIDVKGKIVIARYGGSWRGIKPKVAAEHGAIGVPDLLRSPGRRVLPGRRLSRRAPGAWSSGAQRGSVVDMPLYPGDPLTPGVGATDDAERLTREEAPTITKIPVLPISYGDALPLLRGHGGSGGARGVARRAAAHVPPGPRPCAGPPEARVQLGPHAGLRRHRGDAGL